MTEALATWLPSGFLEWPPFPQAAVLGALTFVQEDVPTVFAALLAAAGNLTRGAAYLGCFLGIWLIRSFATVQCRRRIGAFVRRWTRWEFWPAWLFYAPVVFNYFLLSIRYRSFTVPTAANPGIFSGGMVGESKMVTLGDLQRTSPEFVAKAKPVNHSHDLPFEYPFILKPDIGQRGAGVKLIRSRQQALRYLEGSAAPLIAQDYAVGPQEAGIFYSRFPGQSQGRIFAITEKMFPFVTGDGEKTIEELIWIDPRARCVAKTYLKRLGERRHEIPKVGEIVKLVETGNHAQGCEFRDGMHLWSGDLEKRIDEISQKLNGFFIGRYDIRFACVADLRAGRNFQIIELNGAASEATSIYDGRNSLFTAYQTLFKQWELVFAIGAANERNGVNPTQASHLWRTWRTASAMIANYPIAD